MIKNILFHNCIEIPIPQKLKLFYKTVNEKKKMFTNRLGKYFKNLHLKRFFRIAYMPLNACEILIQK